MAYRQAVTNEERKKGKKPSKFAGKPDIVGIEPQLNLRRRNLAVATQADQNRAAAQARAQAATTTGRPTLRNNPVKTTRAIKTQPTPSGARVALGAQAQKKVGFDVGETRKVIEQRKQAELSAKAQLAADQAKARQQFVGRNPELKNAGQADVDRAMRLQDRAAQARAGLDAGPNTPGATEKLNRQEFRAQSASNAAKARAGQAPPRAGSRANAQAINKVAGDVGQELEALRASAGSNPPENVQNRIRELEARKAQLSGQAQIEGARRGQSADTRAALDKTTPRKQVKAVTKAAGEAVDTAVEKGKPVVEKAIEQGKETFNKARDTVTSKLQSAEVPETPDTPKQKPTLKGAADTTKQAAKDTAKGLKSTFVRGLKGVAKSFAPIGLALQAAETAATPTQEYRDRFGFEDPYADNRASGKAPGFGDFAADLGTRALGTVGDAVNAATFGVVPSNLGIGPGEQPSPIQPAGATQDPAAQAQIAQNTLIPGSDQIGTSGFRRAPLAVGGIGGNDTGIAGANYNAQGPRGSFLEGTQNPNARGGGTFSQISGPAGAGASSADNVAAYDRQTEAVRGLRNAQRAAQGFAPVGQRTFQGYAETGFGARQRAKNAMRGRPDYDPNLTPKQNNSRLANWQAGVDQANIQSGIDPRTGAITGQEGLRARFGQGGSIRDQIAAANLQRQTAKDAFDMQLKTTELGQSLSKEQRAELGDIQTQLTSKDPAMRAQGANSLVQGYLQDPNGRAGQLMMQQLGTMVPQEVNDERGFIDAIRGFMTGGDNSAPSQTISPQAAQQMLSENPDAGVKNHPLLGEYIDLGGGGRYFYSDNNPELAAMYKAWRSQQR